MKIQFDSSQPFQRDAVSAVLDVFDGQPFAQGQYEVNLGAGRGELLTELGRGNRLMLDEETLLQNVRAVQERNNLPPSDRLDGLNFSVEMETGTGKTYVYLRTIYELHARYGFTKFIIVVPSIAIREGVKKSIELMQAHFAALYDSPPCDAWVYDSKRVSQVRQFAAANTLQILIINIAAFGSTANNVIHKENDRLGGRKPIEFVQAAQPMVIIDEPQNMETETARKALASLNPLCTLRYSATHRNVYNLLYRLGPVQAYDLNLVKRIEVASVLEQDSFNRPYVRVESIRATKTQITARLTIDIQGASGVRRGEVSVTRNGQSLRTFSGGREIYEGFVVEEISARDRFIAFSNGIQIAEGQAHGAATEDLMRAQIHETVREHLDKEKQVLTALPDGRRVKVLSLFFIDRVANYASADGKIRRWFEEAYTQLTQRPQYASLDLPPIEKVHNGYFATQGGVAKDSQEGRDTAADDEAYQLIMRDKERLLDRDEPLRFIFSHSALREGWDSPNVFQICTLNETKSQMKKRQEIGRGLRLPVDETGSRVFDPSINRLVVVANESYEDFARKLQTEIEEECGETFAGRIQNRRERRKANLIPGWRQHPAFLALWERIKQRTRYHVQFDTNALINAAAKAIGEMPSITPPTIVAQRAGLDISQQGVQTNLLTIRESQADFGAQIVPDILGYLQRETRLTRSTLSQILIRSERLPDAVTNPQLFLDNVTRVLKRVMQQFIVDGIKYEKLDGTEWSMTLFESHEIEGYAGRMKEVSRSLYDAIECDSTNERHFADALETLEPIDFFLKLPPWFTIDTPLGTYNPDWSLVRNKGAAAAKVYLVCETKTSTEQADLRPSEWAKIQCGRAHFLTLEVPFAPATSPAEMLKIGE